MNITPHDTLRYVDQLTGMSAGPHAVPVIPGGGGGGGGAYPSRMPFGRSSGNDSMAAIQARIRFLEQRIQMLMMQAMQGDNGALKEIKKLQSELEGLYQRLEQLQKQEEARPGAAGAQSQRHFGLGSSPGGSGPGSSAFEGGGRGGGGGSRPPNVPSGWLLGRPNLGYGQPAGGGAGGAGGGAVVLGGDNEWYPFPDEDA